MNQINQPRDQSIRYQSTRALESAMAGEHLVWNDTRAALALRGPIGRLENAIGVGWPDAAGTIDEIGDYWLELKGVMKWPRVPADRPIRLDHDLTKDQRLWLADHWDNGSSCWVILGIREPREWLIWEGMKAGLVIGLKSKDDLISACAVHGIGAFPTSAFVDALRARSASVRVPAPSVAGLHKRP